MPAFNKPPFEARKPLYVHVSADTKDFIKQLNQVSNISEGKIIDAAIILLKSSKVK
jgi:hypothetical protein